MSDVLWIDAAQDTLVGTATIDAVTDAFTIASHGLSDGERITFANLTGGAIGVLEPGGVYWVVNAAPNTFQAAIFQGGPPIDFTANGGADVFRHQPELTARELRRAQSMWLFPGVADPFGARQGVRPGIGSPISVSGTVWTQHDLTAVVYPGITATAGPYVVQKLEESASLDPADGALDRIDALDLQIQDNLEDSSGFRRARVVYVAGVPGATPVPPALTVNSLRLATIFVPAGGTPSPTVQTLAVFTVTTGGILPIRDDTELPTAGRYDGMVVWRQDSRGLEVWNPVGLSWDIVAQRRVATTIRTVNSATTTTTEIVIDTVVAPVVAGRVYKVTWHGRPHVSVSGDDIFLFIREDSVAGTVLQNMVFDIPISFRYGRVTLEAEYIADVTENKTIVTGLNRAAGTGNVSGIASAQDPTYLYVDLVR